MQQLKSALILGASGLVGKHCLQQLLAHPHYERVVVLARHPLELQHPKLAQHTIDFNQLEQWSDYFRVQEVFSCLGYGTSGGDFQKIEYHYPLKAAQIALAQGVKQFFIVTAMLSHPQSRVDLFRIKGELQEQLKPLTFEGLHFFQPALVVGKRAVARPEEEALFKVFKWLSPPLELILRKPLYNPADQIALAMVRIAQETRAGIHFYHSGQIKALATQAES